MRLAVLLSLFALSACSSARSFTISAADLPDDMEWLAALVDVGQVEPVGTGIVRRSPDGSARALLNLLPADARSVTVVGFRDASLVQASAPDERALRAGVIAIARPTDPILPSPDWAASGVAVASGGTVAKIDPASLELTAPWLEACPPASDTATLLLDSDCSPGVPCNATFRRIGACELTIEAADCGLGTLKGVLSGRGRLVLEDGGTLGCQGTEATPGAIASMSCLQQNPQCHADLYLGAPPPLAFDAFALSATASPIVAPDPRHCYSPACTGPSEYIRQRTGYLAEIAAGGGRVAVVENAEPIVTATACSGRPTRLSFFDDARSELTPIGTATGAPCLRALLADPGGDGWIGASVGPTASLLRLNLEGQLRQRMALPEAAYGVRAMRALPGGRLALIAEASSGSSRVMAFASGPSGLSRLWSWSEHDLIENPFDLLPSGETLLVATDQNDKLTTLLTADGSEGATVDISDQGHAPVPLQFAQLTGEPSRLIGVTWGLPSVLCTTPQFRTATYYEAKASAFAIRAWPAQPGHFLVGLTRESDGVALIAIFDPLRPHFLPGSIEVGLGLVSDLVEDSHQAVWGILPWAGRVIRIRAR